jgi:hypothetical protein
MASQEFDKVRAVYERFVLTHGEVKHWMKYVLIYFFFFIWDACDTATTSTHPPLCAVVHSVHHVATTILTVLLGFVRYAVFETKQGEIVNARAIYERACEYFGEDNMHPDL